jgi:integrase
MSVYKRTPRAEFYEYDFWRQRRRFLGSTGARTEREARKIEKEKIRDAEAWLASLKGDAPTSLDLVFKRYWDEVGQHAKSATECRALKVNLARILTFFGKDKLLTDISDNEVAQLVAWRRGQKVARHRKNPRPHADANDPLVANATVNRSTTLVLQRVFARAIEIWKIELPNRPDFSKHLLDEPYERVRELAVAEDATLRLALDPDYEALRQFALASGMRRSECLLRWPQVDFDAEGGRGAFTVVGKGGKPLRRALTTRARSILESRLGHHPEFVFTYVCKHGHRAKGRVPGARLPIRPEGLKTHWKRTKRRAGIQDLRWHDLRHHFATHLLRTTKNLKLVQRALNHARIETR